MGLHSQLAVHQCAAVSAANTAAGGGHNLRAGPVLPVQAFRTVSASVTALTVTGCCPPAVPTQYPH